MPDSHAARTFTQLALQSSHAFARITLQTDYGLIASVSQDGSVEAELADAPPPAHEGTPKTATLTSENANLVRPDDSKASSLEVTAPQDPKIAQLPSATDPSQESTGKPGYEYYIWPDYCTSFVWYEPEWPGNPEGDDNVEESELEERYSASWCRALEAWVEKYSAAFKAQECDLGSKKPPLPDLEERKAWVLEGMLLACWLALQPDVDGVEYQTEFGNYVLEGGKADALGRLLKDMEIRSE